MVVVSEAAIVGQQHAGLDHQEDESQDIPITLRSSWIWTEDESGGVTDYDDLRGFTHMAHMINLIHVECQLT